MPKIPTKVRESGDDVVVGETYEIVKAESTETEKRHFNTIRVSLLTKKKEEGTVMLWGREITTPGSKLGAFITLLGDNTDGWLNRWVKFVEWEEGSRLIEEVGVPK